jgi:hypothetical protein
VTYRPDGGDLTDETKEVMLLLRSSEQPWSLADTRLLDAIDAALHTISWSDAPNLEDRAVTPEDLERILDLGSSAWRVAGRWNHEHLERRIDQTLTDAFQEAKAADPTAADHLATAWQAAYGRNPDPDKAHDEAVLAVEAVACPLVCSPTNTRRTLGRVIADLKSQATQWELALGDTTTNAPMAVDRLIPMLELLWHGQSRHAGSANSRRQTHVEGESAVHLAATLVQWLGSGVLLRRR